MPEISVNSGNIAFIKVVDKNMAQDIAERLEELEDKEVKVEFRPTEEQIAMVFSDEGEITIGVASFMTELEEVESNEGRFLVYVTSPYEPPDPQGGVPVDPPPPDTMCPCG